jgi:L-serine dehydratase
MKTSIFNDVIGPVMRGPSSSHTAASHRIGSIIREVCNPGIRKVTVEFDRGGSLATTYEGQGSSMGLISGLAGLSILDPAITDYKVLPALHKFDIEFIITDYYASHPNTYKIRAGNSAGEIFKFIALSTGGGSILVTNINGFDVSVKGDHYETLICFSSPFLSETDELAAKLFKVYGSVPELVKNEEGNYLFIIKTRLPAKLDPKEILKDYNGLKWIRKITPVLPVLPDTEMTMPFTSIKEILLNTRSDTSGLADFAVKYECALAGIEEHSVLSKMDEITTHIRNSIEKGLKGQTYSDRILGHQAHLLIEAEKQGKIIATPLNKIVAYVTALMESKSSMEIIVAAPTAGSCGVLGGAIFGVADHLCSDPAAIVNAFMAAGLIGVFIADRYTFAAEEGGCQVECGAASAMAAAGLVQLMGGNARQAIDASSMALQNCLGMICDPVADRVEVPCLGKNILAATNALNSANMAIAGFDAVIPFDEVIDAMKSVGNSLPRSLCCTGLGGLSQTPTSLSLLNKLKRS